MRGFTLVELLVALAILGVILLGLLALVRGSLRFTDLTSAMSISIEDIADTEGYITDKLREAKLVLTSLEVLNPDGSTLFDCSPTSSPGRCVALVSPMVDSSQDSQPINNFELSLFVVRPIEKQYATDGLPRGWEGEDTLALFEYRREDLCDSPCSSVSSISLTAAKRTIDRPPGFLLGNLSTTDGAGNDVEFFRLTEGNSNLFMNLVVRADAVTSQPFVVRQTPVALQVAVRR